MAKLSHSKISKYLMCPRSYKYHYVDKLKPVVQSGALLFGSAIDKALNELLLPSLNETAESIFLKEFAKNNAKNDITIVYANSDFDEDLLNQNDYDEASKLLESMGVSLSRKMIVVEYKKLKAQKMEEGFDFFNDNQKLFYNTMNYLSMAQKGLLMIRDYRSKILPMLKKVIQVQIEINHKLDDDTVINGFVDFIAETQDGRIVLFDNKTSGIAYENDAVLNSPQLALYKEAVKQMYPDINIEYAGFIVMRKNIAKNTIKTCGSCGHIGKGRHSTCDNTINGKRCGGEWNEVISPETNFQILIDKIPQMYKDIVIDNYNDVNHAIKKEVFPRNLSRCQDTYGGDCVYRRFCMYGDKKGLKLEETNTTNSNP